MATRSQDRVAVPLPLFCSSDSAKKNKKALDKSSGGGIVQAAGEINQSQKNGDPGGAVGQTGHDSMCCLTLCYVNKELSVDIARNRSQVTQ
jgi:hypothetical protein